MTELSHLNVSLAARIKTVREKGSKQSQAEAAAEVGVSGRTWQAWEAGVSFPWPRHRRALDDWFSQHEAKVAA